MNLRKIIFFMLDRNNMVKQQLDEISKANSDDNFAAQLCQESISNLIAYIKQYVPFYQKFQGNNLSEFPIVNKIMMRENMAAFRSTDKNLKIGKVRHTSGSTGIPFEILQDVRKAKRVQAEVIYYRGLAGDELGTQYIDLITPSKIEANSCFTNIKQNLIAFDVTRMDEKTIEKLHKLLVSNHHIYHMIGYESALEKIADCFIDKGYVCDYSLKGIVSGSEILTDSSMKKISKVFGCPVYDRYSNEDNGFIAQTDGISHEFFVNRGSFYVEILKLDKDEPANENEVGRIVLTDFFNYAQPFVRYDTGDLGSYSYKNMNGARRYVLTKLAGRISDIVYDMNDRPISTFAIGCALEVFDKIKQYQLVQNSKANFELNIIDPSESYTKNEYKDALEMVLGKGIQLQLSYLKNLPTLNSGKFRRIICHYKPN